MLALPLAVAVLFAAPAAPVETPAEIPVHLGVSFRLTHTAELDELRRAQQDPMSPDYRRWLTPEEFGERFGQPPSIYERAASWLEAAGLQVTPAPNRTFLEARGTAAQLSRLLGIQLLRVEGKPVAVHVPLGEPRLPADLKGAVVYLSGLDTRVRYHHRIPSYYGASTPLDAFGPQDLRNFYDIQALLDQGFVGQGQQLVVLSTAESPGNEPSIVDIDYFLQNVSDARTPFIERTLPNQQGDFDQSPGGGTEFELDVEMQSVGSPGADSITLDISPASEIFSTGVNDIVNNLPGATAVSVSLGTCEQAIQQGDGAEIAALRNAMIQGTMEGQTWSAATGDSGDDDCQQSLLSVDFPASIPEMVAAGGSEVTKANWDKDNALTAYQQEVVWNDGSQGGAAGGGLSQIFPTPTYQVGLGVTSRSLPDIALIAGLPGVATDSTVPGQLFTVEGTSVAAPLSAGIFALIASRAGCRLGDVHSALYALGNAQFPLTPDAGAPGVAVFHDITQGNVSFNAMGGAPIPGPSAGPGFDSASGWGSMDVLAIANAWPACPVATPDAGFDAGGDAGSAGDGGSIDAGTADAGQPGDGGTSDAGPSGGQSGPAYSQCAFIGCADGGCTTLPEGPSTCDPTCTSTCTLGNICSTQTLYSANGGFCIPGCNTDADCAGQAGTVCSQCQQVCVPAGNTSAAIGDACASAADCPTGAFCETMYFSGGYCSVACAAGAPAGSACACPSGSSCVDLIQAADCVENCPEPGVPCARQGYLCQPVLNSATGACLPGCQIIDGFDTCQFTGAPPSAACDTTSGYCGGPAVVDAGVDAGVVDAGQPDAGAPPPADAGPTVADAGTPPPPKSGCGCMPGAGSPDAFAGLLALAALALRRRAGRREL